MKGKSVVIVGGAGGLGLATAEMMAARGARIALVDRDAAALARAVERVKASDPAALGIEGDVTTRDGAEALFGQAAEALGRVDSMVNCAGIYPRKPILEITDEDWNASFAVNVRGTHNMMVAAVKHMRPRRDGRIVNISSVDAFKAHPQNAHYAATKAAVVSLTKSFALAFAADQLLINSVAPAGIATEKAKAAGFMPELVAANPLGRAAEPDDIAEMIVFLASSANRYVTGENVVVSGGYIMV
ncbi:MAG: SDR family oxidoreductase [Rhodospirillales bacterium]|nr:SDR family oxidoreductase [Rhodospirillales bacterium]